MSRPPERRLAKLTRPRLRNAIERSRLFVVLDEARHTPVIWVTGPPGAGKTTLVSTYIEARDLPALWYQIDPSDTDPASFFYFLGVGASSLRRGLRLPLLTSEYLPELAHFARSYFRRMFARLPHEAVLVLDNYQEVRAYADLHSIVAQAGAALPPGINLIVISRTVPPAILAQLRATEALTEIAWPALRLTDQECSELCAVRGFSDAALVRRVHSESDGWAAGITLMLTQANADAPSARFTTVPASQPLFDYFAGVVFDGLKREHQDVLLQTAVLPRFDLETARQLCGSENVKGVLDLLGLQQLFLYGSGTRASVFHYHALFKTFLLQRASSTLPGDVMQTLRERAAALMAAKGQVEDAFDLYVSGDSWGAAQELVLGAADGLLAQGRWQTLLGWVDQLPPSHVAEHPRLLYWRGRALCNCALAEARTALEAALKEYAAGGDAIGQLLTLSALIDTVLPENRLQADVPRWLELMEPLLSPPPPWRSSADRLRAYMAYLFAAEHVIPERTDPTQFLDVIVRDLRDPTVDANARAASSVQLLIHLTNTGQTEALAAFLPEVEKLRRGDQLTVMNRALLLVFHAYPEYAVFTRLDSALELLARAETLARDTQLPSLLAVVLQFQAHIYGFYDRDRACAKRALRELESLGTAAGSIGRTFLHSAAVHIASWEDNQHIMYEHALTCLREARQSCTAFVIIFGRETLHAFTDSGRLEEAWQLLAELKTRTTSGCFECSRALLFLHEAYIAAAQGDVQTCHRQLREGLALGRQSERYAVAIYWMGRPLPKLLAIALDAGIEPSFVLQVIARLELPAPDGAGSAWPWPVRVCTLGRFEVSVRGQPLHFGRKAPVKILSLLKALISLGSAEVPEEKLIDALWPDEEGDAGHRAYTITLARLRRLLEDPKALIQRGGCLTLDRRRCWVDVWTFEHLTGGGTRYLDQATSQALTLYGGSFLPDDTASFWSVVLRERLRSRYVALASRAALELESSMQHVGALDLYRRAQYIEPLEEPFYRGMMRCHLALGQRAEAASTYHTLKRLLAMTLSVSPSTETEKLYRQLQQM